MISLDQYRIQIGCFAQKSSSGGKVSLKQQQMFSQNEDRSAKHALGVLQGILKIILIASLLLCGEDLNEKLKIPATCLVHPGDQYYNRTMTLASCLTNVLTDVTILKVKPQHVSQPSPAPNKIVPPDDNNFLARYKYGNRRQNGIKIVHWNKGSSFLENKRDDIETLIDKYHPHILGLSEANLFSHHDISNVQYPGYTLHTCPTISNPELQVSRVVVYTHSSLIVKVRPDLMDGKISAVWLEVGLPNITIPH
jgi:hypothetical protein